MSNINKTMNIGGSAEANSILQKPATDDFRRAGKPGETASEYRAVENAQKVADAAEIRPQEILSRLSREDYQRHKEVVTDLETALSQVVDKKALEEGRMKGIVRFGRDQLTRLQAKVHQETIPGKKQILLKQVQAIKEAIDTVKKVQGEMEKKFAAKGPVDVPKARTDLALNKLGQIYGEKIPQELIRQPAKIRELVTGRLQKNLQALSDGRRKLSVELRRQIDLRKTGKADEKRIRELQLEEQRFLRGEKLYSDTIVHAEGWARELEKGTVESELRESLRVGDDQESVATEGEGSGGTSETSAATPTTSAPAREFQPGGALVGISSAGGEGPFYEGGDSDYIEMNRAAGATTVQSQAAGGASRPSDLMIDIATSTTRVAVMENAGRVREESRRTKRVIDQIMRRLMAGDYRVLDLALIMLSHQAAMSTVMVGAKMVRALDEQDRQQQQVVAQLDQLSAENPNFASQASAANLQVNKIATDRQATMNLLRTALTSMEEIQNVTKSYLDIVGAQYRHLSRFNT